VEGCDTNRPTRVIWRALGISILKDGEIVEAHIDSLSSGSNKRDVNRFLDQFVNVALG
jgi:hypothetical protein